jgi:hypothetical protein
MHQALKIARVLGISILLGVSLCVSFSYAGPIGDRHATRAAVPFDVMGSAAGATTMKAETRQGLFTSVPAESAVALRTLPSVSKQILVGGTTFLPYIGAGFGGGYATEFDRSLHAEPFSSSPSSSTNAGLRSLFGQHLIPNEVQLGIRVPF